ncbi:YesL family protein [Phytoactinopolyspora halotolerans]|uniref:DUF624 domain-containing protein n=1 Tax=Phytoactinopolyspora halotolerans TaxID=1981512 RepID=A0A6L9S871_9ACTN|nr:DUF624 domain-containing protein [Phytoactinopolyspora halotolerans]NEE00891.1 DUF624 domain-containing protein [Phytoactinopolyspora halotolerans]
MNRLLGWHIGLGETGLRLFQLHLLWLGWTLVGGVVLGVFPATAAVYAVLRKDLMRGGDDGGGQGGARAAPRARLRTEFRAAWRREFRAANCLGYTFVAIWSLLLFDRHLLTTVDLGALGPLLAGLLWLLTVFVFGMTACVGTLSAHFSESVPALVRRSAVFVLARPVYAAVNAVVVAVVLCVYYLIPGLVPVFGLVVPAYFSFVYIFSTGILPNGTRHAPSTTSRTITPSPARSGGR